MRMIDLNTELTELELLQPVTVSAAVNGPAVNVANLEGVLKVMLHPGSASSGASGAAITVGICTGIGSASIASTPVASFTAIGSSGAAVQSLSVNTRSLDAWIQAQVSVTGSPSGIVAVDAVGQPQIN